jgi:triosephosphate isomerase
VQTLIDGDRLPIGLAAQNCHWEAGGPYTGEVSPPMLAKLKVAYALCGHSERRELFGETDAVVNRKVKAVAAAGMTPLLCVGETLEHRESGEAENVVVGQLRGSLEAYPVSGATDLVVAYEPVWAIGTGRTATPGDADDMCGAVRRALAELFGAPVAAEVRVLYGGSVKPGNIAELMRREEIDGALVGGASIDAEDFAVICRYHRL